MCTVSWLHESNGYHLLCNRDEKKTRLPAHHPQIDSRGGVRFIAPRDADLGGAWIAANEFGLTLCLLNMPGASRPRSRGHVIPQLIAAACLEEVTASLAAIDLTDTSPFTLAIVSPLGTTMTAEWCGENLTFPRILHMPLTSSSFDTEAVCDARRAQFERGVRAARRVDSNVLHAFHENHGAVPNAYSTCMHRPDAETVSFSWITVNDAAVDFFYTPAAPCKWHPGETHRLVRKR